MFRPGTVKPLCLEENGGNGQHAGSVLHLINIEIGTPATIFVSALLTFLFCAGIARLIALLPKSKYLIG